MNIRPLVAWLLVSVVVTNAIFSSQTVTYIVATCAIVLYGLSLSQSNRARYVATLLSLATALSAIALPVPLPETWSVLIRLGIIVCVWMLLALTIALLTSILLRR